MKIGYACIPLTISARTSKKVLLKNFSEESFLQACAENIRNLKVILIHNINNNIRFFRISSDIIPLASHPINTIDWQTIFKTELEDIGNFIKENDIRVSMHPGQYTVINSPNQEVVKKSIADLEYHCKFLNSLNIDSSHKIILHIGGIYGDKITSKNRFIENYKLLSQNIKERLIIENDERNYSIDDVLEISSLTGAPVVFDNLHNESYGNNNYTIPEILTRVIKTWKNTKGIPKVHYSQQSYAKKKGAHSSTIFVNEFLKYYNDIKNFDIDIMLEVKDKDISAIKCINILDELTGKEFNPEFLMNEYKKYKLLLLERGEYFSNHAYGIAAVNTDVISFYRVIDEALESFIKPLSFSHSLRTALKLIENDIKASEKNHIEKLLLNSKFERCKTYMHEVAIRNNVESILSTYFFSQE